MSDRIHAMDWAPPRQIITARRAAAEGRAAAEAAAAAAVRPPEEHVAADAAEVEEQRVAKMAVAAALDRATEAAVVSDIQAARQRELATLNNRKCSMLSCRPFPFPAPLLTSCCGMLKCRPFPRLSDKLLLYRRQRAHLASPALHRDERDGGEGPDSAAGGRAQVGWVGEPQRLPAQPDLVTAGDDKILEPVRPNREEPACPETHVSRFWKRQILSWRRSSHGPKLKILGIILLRRCAEADLLERRGDGRLHVSIPAGSDPGVPAQVSTPRRPYGIGRAL